MNDLIFVFGSNEGGIHGKGAALFAKQKYGAQYGKGFGLQGKSFGIPTKDKHLKVLSLDRIGDYINAFLIFAGSNPTLAFMLTPIGCGLAGYKKEEILPLFLKYGKLPSNILFTKHWFEE